ncbi:hypothetical protein J2767_003563 [Agrobacterium tumefaciens]|uniref:hypothetical protein n=1 Tax=Agrobacterium tumefaciens TaxID=358 RepID=UPI001AE18AA3|nr:hypothetical protein [Agrobacterium tumefaciens]MBP2572385.1 hypothetical protein [Agrobacterium tumefaciens]
MIHYLGFNGMPYSLAGGTPDCYVKDGSERIATFETLSLRDNGNIFHIDHFALDSSRKKQRLGEVVLRGFARLVAQQLPDVNQITFELYRCLPGTDLEKLASARSDLLERVGAHDVTKVRPNNHHICVTGKWARVRW